MSQAKSGQSLQRQSSFFDDLKQFVTELLERGPSDEEHSCWSCDTQNEALAIVNVIEFFKLADVQDARIKLCRWCLPKFMNSYEILSAKEQGRDLCHEHDLLPVPIKLSQLGCLLRLSGADLRVVQIEKHQ